MISKPSLSTPGACTWPERLGSWAERDPDTRTLCRTQRRVPWRLRPATAADVREVVAQALEHGTALWPVSTGRNWGYGSHLPARDGAVILDLSRLRAISDLDRRSLSIRVEPGVTQGDLYAYLARNAPDLAFNVTGAGSGASVLGNALERGIGYAGERDREIYALEVLLSDGTLLAPNPGRNHPSRPHPAGLATDALFFQTNFGIVLGARLRLRLRQQAEEAVVVQGPFGPVMETLKDAYARQLITNPTHVAEPGRTGRLGTGLLRLLWRREPTAAEVAHCFPETNEFNGLLPLCGQRRVVNAAWAEMRKLARPGVALRRIDARRLDLAARWLGRLGVRGFATRLRALRPIFALTWGEPSDAGMTAIDGYAGGDPDHAGHGAMYGNAVSAFELDDAGRAAAIVRAHWKECAFTWIAVDCRTVITVYTLHFVDADAEAAHAANAVITRELRAAGFPPYRLDVETAAPGGAEEIVRRLKAALDPGGIVAPGRYEAPCDAA